MRRHGESSTELPAPTTPPALTTATATPSSRMRFLLRRRSPGLPRRRCGVELPARTASPPFRSCPCSCSGAPPGGAARLGCHPDSRHMAPGGDLETMALLHPGPAIRSPDPLGPYGLRPGPLAPPSPVILPATRGARHPRGDARDPRPIRDDGGHLAGEHSRKVASTSRPWT